MLHFHLKRLRSEQDNGVLFFPKIFVGVFINNHISPLLFIKWSIEILPVKKIHQPCIRSATLIENFVAISDDTSNEHDANGL